MDTNDLSRKVANAFGLRWLSTISISEMKDSDGQIIDTFMLLAYWTAEITFFDQRRARGARFDNLIIGVLRTENWAKGIIIIPPIQEPLNRTTGGPDPLYPLDITHWDEPVTSALQSVNIFPLHPGGELHERNGYWFEMEYATRLSRGQFRMEGPIGHSHHSTLWKALLRSVHHFANIYNNDELRYFIAQPDSSYILNENEEDLTEI